MTWRALHCQALGRGVTRSKRRAMKWCRKAADVDLADACQHLARAMYINQPYAREAGHVAEDVDRVAGIATPAMLATVMQGHDVPPDVLISVVRWLLRGKVNLLGALDTLQRIAREGAKYCFNDGCEIVGHVKDFKVCPQCKINRYCGAACQKQDWTTGGHREKCGTIASNLENTS